MKNLLLILALFVVGCSVNYRDFTCLPTNGTQISYGGNHPTLRINLNKKTFQWNLLPEVNYEEWSLKQYILGSLEVSAVKYDWEINLVNLNVKLTLRELGNEIPLVSFYYCKAL